MADQQATHKEKLLAIRARLNEAPRDHQRPGGYCAINISDVRSLVNFIDAYLYDSEAEASDRLEDKHSRVGTAMFATLWMLLWLAGTVKAAGFWSTVAAIFFPPWAWYIVVEAAMKAWGAV